jgi:uncharacterized repeat protein (TIGR02543 family)
MKKKLILPIIVLLLLSVFVVQASALAPAGISSSPVIDLTTKVVFKLEDPNCVSSGKYQIQGGYISSGLTPYEYTVQEEKVDPEKLPPLAFFDIYRKGYTFVKWEVKIQDQDADYLTGETPTSFITSTKKTITVIATPVWKPNVLKVVYNVNYASLQKGSVYKANEHGTIMKNNKVFTQSFICNAPKNEKGLVNASTFKLQRQGYHFLGWSTSKNGKVILDENTPMGARDITSSIIKGNKTVTLYAQWIPKTVNVIYSLNDDTETITNYKYEFADNGIKDKNEDVFYSQKYIYKKNIPVKINGNIFGIERPFSEFVGWSSKPNGKGTIFKAGQKITYKEIAPLLTGNRQVVRLYPVWHSYTFPLNKKSDIYVSSLQGLRIHPIYKEERYHSGTDIAAGYGSPIYAVDSGMVVEVGLDTGSGYGNYVVISHGNGVRTLYAHASKLLVKEGQTVKQGQTIAKVGSTGTSTGNHLHLEVIIKGERKDPMKYIDFSGVPVRV